MGSDRLVVRCQVAISYFSVWIFTFTKSSGATQVAEQPHKNNNNKADKYLIPKSIKHDLGGVNQDISLVQSFIPKTLTERWVILYKTSAIFIFPNRRYCL